MAEANLFMHERDLTLWGWDKMADILQTTFSNAFSWRNVWYFDSNFTDIGDLGPIDNNKAALCLILAWCQTSKQPLSGQVLALFTDVYLLYNRNKIIVLTCFNTRLRGTTIIIFTTHFLLKLINFHSKCFIFPTSVCCNISLNPHI